MGLSLIDFARQTRPLSLPWGDDAIHFEYRPLAMTPELEDELSHPPEGETPSVAFCKSFCVLVASWDLKAEPTDKKPLPVTLETVRRVPTKILGQMLEAIREDASPPKPEPTVPGSFT